MRGVRIGRLHLVDGNDSRGVVLAHDAPAVRTPPPDWPGSITGQRRAASGRPEAQQLVVADRLGGGEHIIGAKLGMTSAAMQRAIGINQPVCGWLTSGMVLPYGQPVACARFIHARAEPEIAFVLAEPPPAPATTASVLAATEAVMGAIEVLDSRYQDYHYRRPDVIADNVGAAGVILGPQRRAPRDVVDLRLLGCVFRAADEVLDTAAGGAALGHPAAAVAWLINALAEQDRVLPAGSIVLSGGLTAPVPLTLRLVLSADFDGLGTVEVVST